VKKFEKDRGEAPPKNIEDENYVKRKKRGGGLRGENCKQKIAQSKGEKKRGVGKPVVCTYITEFCSINANRKKMNGEGKHRGEKEKR